MSRTRLYQILICLLCLSPTWSLAQTLTQYEYWFDDDFSARQTVGLSGYEADIDVGIDASSLGNGLHKFSLRLQQSDGMFSPVTTGYFFTAQVSDGGKLEYWFDDDREKVNTVDGKASSDGEGLIFISDLDLNTVSQGSHRMYYRLIDSKGKPSSAVSMTPLMVNSKYNVANTEALTVAEQLYWFDDEEPEIKILSDRKNTRDMDLTLDARKLAIGKHTLHLQYGNSANVWNSPIEATFIKEKVEDPLIFASSNVDDGTVNLTFNSLPYAQSYTVVRQYPSGNKRVVEVLKTTEHPAVLKSIDKPGPGSYTYYVDARYIDADGARQMLRSNEMGVTVEKAASDVKRGTIHGKIKNDGLAIGPSTIFSVYINGNRSTSQEEYVFRYDGYGGFDIYDIPYNTEITISIKQSHYKFNDLTLIVNENTDNKPLYLNGTWTDEEEEILPESDAFDLELADKIHITPNGWEIPIYNLSSKTWSGNLIVKVISKKVQDKFGKSYSNEDESALDILYYKTDICYTTIADMPVKIQGCREGSKVVVLDITNMPNTEKNEEYYVYFFSKKDDSEETKMLEGSIYHPNPQTVNFNPSDYGAAIKNGVVSYMDEYAELFKYMKKFAEWGDPFKLGWNSAEEAWNNYLKLLEKRKHDANANELLEDAFDTYLRSAGLLMNCFYGEMNQLVIKELTDNKAYKASAKICELYDLVKGSYNATQADDNHKFFELAKQVLKISVKLGADPVLNCYKTFFEVGEKMVDAIENMSQNIHDYDVWNKLYSGLGIYKIKIRKYTDSKNGVAYFKGSDFFEHTVGYHHITHDGQIKSISIKLIDLDNDNHNLTQEVDKDKVELVDDGIIIKDLRFLQINAQPQRVDAWMTIVWKNDRVTRVPLLEKDFVKLENFDKVKSDVPLIMTVELQSGCYLYKQGIPNHLSFVKPSYSWFD